MNHTHEERTGEELPTKGGRIANAARLSLNEFYAVRDVDFVGRPSWGSAQNNPCNLYRSKDGRWIEEGNYPLTILKKSAILIVSGSKNKGGSYEN